MKNMGCLYCNFFTYCHFIQLPWCMTDKIISVHAHPTSDWIQSDPWFLKFETVICTVNEPFRQLLIQSSLLHSITTCHLQQQRRVHMGNMPRWQKPAPSWPKVSPSHTLRPEHWWRIWGQAASVHWICGSVWSRCAEALKQRKWGGLSWSLGQGNAGHTGLLSVCELQAGWGARLVWPAPAPLPPRPLQQTARH